MGCVLKTGYRGIQTTGLVLLLRVMVVELIKINTEKYDHELDI